MTRRHRSCIRQCKSGWRRMFEEDGTPNPFTAGEAFATFDAPPYQAYSWVFRQTGDQSGGGTYAIDATGIAAAVWRFGSSPSDAAIRTHYGISSTTYGGLTTVGVNFNGTGASIRLAHLVDTYVQTGTPPIAAGCDWVFSPASRPTWVELPTNSCAKTVLRFLRTGVYFDDALAGLGSLILYDVGEWHSRLLWEDTLGRTHDARLEARPLELMPTMLTGYAGPENPCQMPIGCSSTVEVELLRRCNGLNPTIYYLSSAWDALAGSGDVVKIDGVCYERTGSDTVLASLASSPEVEGRFATCAACAAS